MSRRQPRHPGARRRASARPGVARAQDPPYVGWTAAAARPDHAVRALERERLRRRAHALRRRRRSARCAAASTRLADSCDHDAIFALAYLRTTEEYRRTIEDPTFFEDTPFVNHEDAVFARLLLRRLRRLARGAQAAPAGVGDRLPMPPPTARSPAHRQPLARHQRPRPARPAVRRSRASGWSSPTARAASRTTTASTSSSTASATTCTPRSPAASIPTIDDANVPGHGRRLPRRSSSSRPGARSRGATPSGSRPPRRPRRAPWSPHSIEALRRLAGEDDPSGHGLRSAPEQRRPRRLLRRQPRLRVSAAS